MTRPCTLALALAVSACVAPAHVTTESDTPLTDTAPTEDTATTSPPDTGPPPETPPLELCINEFMPNNQATWSDPVTGATPDWVELHNPTAAAVSLDGWSITDNRNDPRKHGFATHLEIEAGGFMVLQADGRPELGPRHLSFLLDALGEEIALFRADLSGTIIEYGPMERDVAVARVPDCCDEPGCLLTRFGGTPAATNVTLPTSPDLAVPKQATWTYLDTGVPPASDWTQPGFDDATWGSGPAPLGWGDPFITTAVSYGPDPDNRHVTTWFRHEFQVEDVGDVLGGALLLMRDDGALVTLNGTEIARANMPDGAIDDQTLAEGAIHGADETFFGLYRVDPSLLVEGTNALAAEVHLFAPTSRDLAFDASLVLDRVFLETGDTGAPTHTGGDGTGDTADTGT